MAESEQEQRTNSVPLDDKTRKLRYWGLGLIALGIVLLAPVPFLHLPGVDMSPVLLIGVGLSFPGLILLAKSKGLPVIFGILALAPVVGPVLGVLSIFLIDASIHGKRWRIEASYIASVLVFFGALVAIAVPNFMTYGAKARQSEAKVGLGGIFVTATAMKGEQKTFVISDINQLGYMPSGSPRYRLWYAVKGVPTLIPANYRPNSCDGPPTTIKVAASATGFTAAARGNMDGDPTCDEWSINDARVMTNTINDVVK